LDFYGPTGRCLTALTPLQRRAFAPSNCRPYETDAAVVGAACRRNGLKLLSINTPPGDQAGDFGLGAVAGRAADFIAGLDLAIAYARAAGGASLHVMAGVVPARER